MRYKKITPSSFILRLSRGEEVIGTLTDFCQQNKIFSGSFSGLGAADSIELAHYSVKTKEYTHKIFTGEHEVATITGIITSDKVHVHATIANNTFVSYAGHLAKMVISGACEIHLFAGEESIGRTLDPEIGLQVLDV